MSGRASASQRRSVPKFVCQREGTWQGGRGRGVAARLECQRARRGGGRAAASAGEVAPREPPRRSSTKIAPPERGRGFENGARAREGKGGSQGGGAGKGGAAEMRHACEGGGL